jgi:hypothetical protein
MLVQTSTHYHSSHIPHAEQHAQQCFFELFFLSQRILRRGDHGLSQNGYGHTDSYVYIYKNMGRGQGWVAVGRMGGSSSVVGGRLTPHKN